MTKSDLLPVTIDEAVDGHLSADLPTITVRVPAWEGMADYSFAGIQWYFFDSIDHQVGWESFTQKIPADMVGKETVFILNGTEVLKPYNGTYALVSSHFIGTDIEPSPASPAVRFTIGELVQDAPYFPDSGVFGDNTIYLGSVRDIEVVISPFFKHAGDIIVPYIQFQNTETGVVGPVTSLEPHVLTEDEGAEHSSYHLHIPRMEADGYNYFTVYYTVKRYDRPVTETSLSVSCNLSQKVMPDSVR